jgi:CheY-like chemotaxis protein
LTAQKTHDDQAAAHEAGCDTFVEKPIDPERLFEAVKRVLG